MSTLIHLSEHRWKRVERPGMYPESATVSTLTRPEPPKLEPQRYCLAKPKPKTPTRPKRECIAGLEYYPRLKRWKGCNGKAWLDPVTLESRSYDWWLVTRQIGDQVVYNDYRYSPTTSGHQWSIRAWLESKSIPFVSIQAPQGLQKLESAVDYYNREIETLESEIAKPRSRASKNAERREMIDILVRQRGTVYRLQSLEAEEERQNTGGAQ